MSNICIIPARGGSKRIPRKNIKTFLGKPIIAYVIELAIRTNLFDVVMVSTDDDEIASISKMYGAQVPFLRSSDSASDFASTEDVILEVLSEYKNSHNVSFNSCCCFYPTGVLAKIEDVSKGYNLLISTSADVVFPVVSFHFPIWRGVRRNEQGETSPLWPEYSEYRSQDLEKTYHDAGQWYWVNVDSFKKTKKLYSENILTTELDGLQVQDIDEETDWKLAELKYKIGNFGTHN